MNDVTLAHICGHIGDCFTAIADRLAYANRAETDAMDKALAETDAMGERCRSIDAETSAADAFDTQPVDPDPPAPLSGEVSAPIIPPTAAPAPTSNELDASGLPWDARIHSANHGTVANGNWRTKRGVDKALIPVVEAELRGVAPDSNPPAPTPTPTPTPADNAAYLAFTQKIKAGLAAGTLTDEAVAAACAAAGVPAYPLMVIQSNWQHIPTIQATLQIA